MRWRRRASFPWALDRVRAILAHHPDIPPMPADARFVRQYPGHWQRAAGAWSWFVMADSSPMYNVGSQYPLRDLKPGRTDIMPDWGGLGWDIFPRDV